MSRPAYLGDKDRRGEGRVLEIEPVPHRSTRREMRQLALGLTIMVPVVLLVLLPAVLGLDRVVVTDRGMDGSLGRGSVVLARKVAPSDLKVNDVITFRPPGASGDVQVTRRIVVIEHDVATTRADSTGLIDPWTLPLTAPSYSRVWLGIPWIGYPFVLDGGWVLLTMIAAAALIMGITTGRRRPGPVPERSVAPRGVAV